MSADTHSSQTTPRIAVFGGRVSSDQLLDEAFEVGRLIAGRGGLLYCGGMGGVMEAASKGARESGGDVVGILPTGDTDHANPYISIPVVTGIGTARNSIIARSVHGGIAIDGRYGTLSEIAYGIDFNKPIIGINTWDIEGVIPAKDAAEAIEKLWEVCTWQ
ncbi:MAG: TIGR00725 family protein [Candidatus Marinimicrobia bacterium]|nr:TIGR00725 family protein [Candidatus Neomarinimicrobiota bacterium]MCF7830057.1 TIGR00725 family protein [Candidatus Neomarinimicrobiota bacterium]MCF7882358.1 TIGR00725 family protein [Candidatus Neomarinimicrobiota bacterium]